MDRHLFECYTDGVAIEDQLSTKAIADRIDIAQGQRARDSVALIVPTYNERENIEALYTTVASALSGLDWEIMFVDDNSPDGTAAAAEALASKDPRVRLVVRFHDRGLTSAVLQGIYSVTMPNVVVTDADLQHDLLKVPEMLRLLNADEADLVIATRYQAEGSAGGLSTRFRTLLSDLGTRIGKVLFRVPVSDPMSGFFAFRRKSLLPVLTRVDPLGFKILLDVLLLGRGQMRVREVPYSFHSRHAGSSKLNWRVQWDFMIQVLYHLMHGFIPHDLISFVLVGASGAVLQFTILGIFYAAGLAAETGQAAAIVSVTLWNFLLNHYLTFHRELKLGRDLLQKFVLYALATAIGIMLNISAATLTLESLRLSRLPESLLGACIDTIWRFAIARSLIWRR